MMLIKNYKQKEHIKIESDIIIHDLKCKKRTRCALGCTEIEKVTVWKYLGLQWDQNLLWHKHIDKIKDKLRFLAIRMQQAKAHLNSKIKILSYDALVNSVIKYGITCYSQASNYLVKKIDSLINILTKILCIKQDYYKSKIERYKSLKALNIKQMWMKEIIQNTCKTIDLNKYRKEHKYNTRLPKKQNFRINKVGNRYKKRSMDYILPNIYKQIDIDEIRELKKKSISKYLNEKLLRSPIELEI